MARVTSLPWFLNVWFSSITGLNIEAEPLSPKALPSAPPPLASSKTTPRESAQKNSIIRLAPGNFMINRVQ
jgi:hypothetical protein